MLKPSCSLPGQGLGPLPLAPDVTAIVVLQLQGGRCKQELWGRGRLCREIWRLCGAGVPLGKDVRGRHQGGAHALRCRPDKGSRSAHHSPCLDALHCSPSKVPQVSMLLGLARGRATALHGRRQGLASSTGCQHVQQPALRHRLCCTPKLLVSPDAQACGLSSCQTKQQDHSSSTALCRESKGWARLTSLSPLRGEVSAYIPDPGHQRGLWHCQLLQHVEVICGSLVHGAARWQKGAAGGCLGKGVGPAEDLQGSSSRGGQQRHA